MKKLILIILFHNFLVVVSLGQSISSLEYFFNTDPGVGQGTVLNVDSNNGELVQSFDIPTTGLSQGFHSFYIRALNENESWGLYDRSIIYIMQPTELSVIDNAEYFFDLDPGVGNGTLLNINSDNDNETHFSFNIPTEELQKGFHSFYIRVRDDKNNWSFYDRSIFYLAEPRMLAEITEAEYFF